MSKFSSGLLIGKWMLQFYQSLEEIPVGEKSAYLLALEKAPDLVQSESDPIRFVRCENGNGKAAAGRFVRYWMERRKTFGERAFRSVLDLSGHGALTNECIDFLRCGCIAPLPNDNEGRTVLCMDDTGRWSDRESNEDLRRKCLFYWHQYCSRNTTVQSSGIVVLRLVMAGNLVATQVNPSAELINEAFPFKLKAAHVCAFPKDLTWDNFVENVIPSLKKRVDEEYKSADCALLHAQERPEDFAKVLTQYGLVAEGLPESIGGKWKSESLNQLIESQQARCIVPGDAAAHNMNSSPYGSMLAVYAKAQPKVAPSDDRKPSAFSARGGSTEPSANTRSSSAFDWMQPVEPSQTIMHDRKLPPEIIYGQKGPRSEHVEFQIAKGSYLQSNAPWMTSKGNNHGFPSPLPNTKRLKFSLPTELAKLMDPQAVPRPILDQLERTLLNFPDQEKRAYLEARSVAPGLVASESAIYRFLRCEDNDVTLALSRLLRYWKTKKEIFGDRALLPRNRTLLPNDVEVLRTGLGCILPSDSMNRPVLCFDRSRFSEGQNDQARRRCIFYLFSVAAEEATSMTEGIVNLHIMNSSSCSPALASVFPVLCEALPVKLHSSHFVFCPPVEKPWHAAQSELQRMTEKMRKLAFVHNFESAMEAVERLKDYGMVRDGIPTSLGGTWTQDKFIEGQSHRTLLKGPELGAGALKPGPGPTMLKDTTQNFPMELLGTAAMCCEPHLTAAPASRPSKMPITHADRKVCVEQIDRAMQFVENKSDYLRAKSTGLLSESDPVRFWRIADSNAALAANRLAAYWEKRKEIYSCRTDTERAFLPMSQTGEGTLLRSDISALSNCCFLVLQCDSKGRTVLCYDTSKASKLGRETRLRLAFYHFSIAAENDASQEDGVVMMVALDKGASDLRGPSFSPILDVLPVHIQCVHVLHSGRDPGLVSLEAVAPSIGNMFGSAVEGKVKLHVATSKERLASKLEAFGLSRDALPKFLGGNRGYGKFVQWQELRTRFEWGLPPGANCKDTEHMFTFGRTKALSELTEEERIERKRRMNVIHSRRKRERERIEIEVLQEQVNDLGDKNRSLTEENRKFENLLNVANAKLGKFEQCCSSDELRCVEQQGSEETSDLAMGEEQSYLKDSVNEDDQSRATLKQTSNPSQSSSFEEGSSTNKLCKPSSTLLPATSQANGQNPTAKAVSQEAALPSDVITPVMECGVGTGAVLNRESAEPWRAANAASLDTLNLPTVRPSMGVRADSFWQPSRSDALPSRLPMPPQGATGSLLESFLLEQRVREETAGRDLLLQSREVQRQLHIQQLSALLGQTQQQGIPPGTALGRTLPSSTSNQDNVYKGIVSSFLQNHVTK